jgi:hypothetical protein
VVVVLVLGVLQVALVGRDQVALEAVARDAARAAAVSSTPGAAAGATAERMSEHLRGVRVEVVANGTTVTVIARAPPTRVPLLGALVDDELTARATMLVEPP